MSKATRRHFTAGEKVGLLRAYLVEGRPISALCEENSLHSSVFYNGHRQFFENGAPAFKRESTGEDLRIQSRIAHLEETVLKQQRVGVPAWPTYPQSNGKIER